MNRQELVGHPGIAATSRGAGCGIVFGLTFMGVSGYLILPSMDEFDQLRSRGDVWSWLPIGFGSIFALAGLAAALKGVAEVYRALAARKRKQEHPLEPWFWDYPWDTRWAESGSLGPAFKSFVVFLLVALFLSVFNWLAFYSSQFPWPLKLIVSVFDLAALAMLGHSIYQLVQYLKYGKSRLHFARFPFRPGRSVEAGLEAGSRLAAASSLDLTLRYIEEVTETTGSGEDRRSVQVLYCLHEVKQEFRAGQFDIASGLEIPITIRLPDGDYANRLLETPRRYWELEVKAETPGVDYLARFLLPVY